ncbi:MAG: hypothetical protein EAZ89_15650 [Bacteroidetes bacterium]|nr:MAG: hypothetical protein EAZ89_15650 [Bacteroidota bacterium]
MPPQIRKLAQEILKAEPVEINLNLAKPAANINQMAYFAGDTQKIALLEHVIRTREVESMIIFASSKINVDRIHRTLESLKYPVKAIHSDKEQEERSETLRQFKNRQFKILVGTDVLSRGIDIDSLSHVLNYDVPPDAEDYVHRAGRTARAGAFGEAISFISPKDIRRWQQIEKLIGYEVKKYDLPEEVGPAPDMSEGRERGGFDRRRGGGAPDRRGPAPDRRGPDRRGPGGPPRHGQGPRQEDRGPRPENRGPRPEDRGPRPENPAAPRPEQGPLAEGEVVRKKRKKKRNRPRPQGAPGAVANTGNGAAPAQLPQNEAGTGENRPKPRRRHRPRPKNGPGPQVETPPSAE